MLCRLKYCPHFRRSPVARLPLGATIATSPGFNRSPGDPETMTLTALLWLLLPLLLIVAIVDALTMSTDRRVRLLRNAGLSQSAIAQRLGVTRYRVRQALA